MLTPIVRRSDATSASTPSDMRAEPTKLDRFGFVLVLQQRTDHALTGADVADQRIQQGFGGAGLAGRQSAEILAAITLAWWDRHVKHEQGATVTASPS